MDGPAPSGPPANARKAGVGKSGSRAAAVQEVELPAERGENDRLKLKTDGFTPNSTERHLPQPKALDCGSLLPL
jgi:hypothetical protein